MAKTGIAASEAGRELDKRAPIYQHRATRNAARLVSITRTDIQLQMLMQKGGPSERESPALPVPNSSQSSFNTMGFGKKTAYMPYWFGEGSHQVEPKLRELDESMMMVTDVCIIQTPLEDKALRHLKVPHEFLIIKVGGYWNPMDPNDREDLSSGLKIKAEKWNAGKQRSSINGRQTGITVTQVNRWEGTKKSQASGFRASILMKDLLKVLLVDQRADYDLLADNCWKYANETCRALLRKFREMGPDDADRMDNFLREVPRLVLPIHVARWGVGGALVGGLSFWTLAHFGMVIAPVVGVSYGCLMGISSFLGASLFIAWVLYGPETWKKICSKINGMFDRVSASLNRFRTNFALAMSKVVADVFKGIDVLTLEKSENSSVERRVELVINRLKSLDSPFLPLVQTILRELLSLRSQTPDAPLLRFVRAAIDGVTPDAPLLRFVRAAMDGVLHQY